MPIRPKGSQRRPRCWKLKGLPVTDENIFIAAACKEKGIRFLKGEAEIGVRKIDKTAPAAATTQTAAAAPAKSPDGPAEYTVTVNGKDHFMAFEDDMVTVDGKVYRVAIKPEAGGVSAPAAAATATAATVTEVKAQMPGAVYKQLVHAGDQVHEGEAILILEAMKMEMEVVSPVDGTVEKIHFAVGQQVTAGQVLATIKS